MAEDAERTERIIDVLTASTRVTTEVVGHIKGVDRELSAMKDSHERGLRELRETLRFELDNLLDEMRTTTAHLDNLIRETVVTNTILQEDMASRQAAETERRANEKEDREYRRKVEGEEREWRRGLEARQLDRKEKVEDDKRSTLKKVGEEAWSIAKQPLAYLVVAVILFLTVRYFGMPVPIESVPYPSP